MLERLERHLGPISEVKTEAAALGVLAEIVADFGFRSGYVVDYSPGQAEGPYTLDTWPERAAAGAQLVGRLGHTQALQGMNKMRDETRLLRFRPEDFTPGHPFLAFARDYDLSEFVGVPIDEGPISTGLVGFSGTLEGKADTQIALQLICYRLFSQLRQARLGTTASDELVTITLRERQVMSLSASGMTSSEIAHELGLAERTVNQHVTNATEKLGTRNRVHTIAELLRRKLID